MFYHFNYHYLFTLAFEAIRISIVLTAINFKTLLHILLNTL